MNWLEVLLPELKAITSKLSFTEYLLQLLTVITAVVFAGKLYHETELLMSDFFLIPIKSERTN